MTSIAGAPIPAPANVLGTTASGQLTRATAEALSVVRMCAAASASGSAYTCSTTPTFAPAAQDEILFKADVANTGAATLNVNGSTAAPIVKLGGTAALAQSDVASGQWTVLIYDGTNWQMQGQSANSSAGDFSGTLAIANGGTNATTAAGALTNLGAAASGANNDITSLAALTSVTSAVNFSNSGSSFAGNAATATTASSVPYSGLTGTVPTWNQNTTGTAASITGTITGSQVTGNIAGSQITGNITGNAASITGTITGSQVTGNIAGAQITGNISGNAASITGTITGSQVTGNIAGNAANVTATSNSTLTTLSSLALPYSQLSGVVPTWNQSTTGNAATANSAITAGSATTAGSFTGSLAGDVTGTQGATKVVAINNGSVPVSAHILGTNANSQPIAASASDLAAPVYAADSGSVNASVVTLVPAPAALTTGLEVDFKPAVREFKLYANAERQRPWRKDHYQERQQRAGCERHDDRGDCQSCL